MSDFFAQDDIAGETTRIKYLSDGFMVMNNLAFKCLKYSNITELIYIHDDGNYEFRMRHYGRKKQLILSSRKNFRVVAEKIIEKWKQYIIDNDLNTSTTELEYRLLKIEKSLKELKEILLYAPPSPGGPAYVEAIEQFENNIKEL